MHRKHFTRKNILAVMMAACLLGITGCEKTEPATGHISAQTVSDTTGTKEDKTPDSSAPGTDGASAPYTGDLNADEILDLFINGTIDAIDPADGTSAFYIDDLNIDSGEWDSYSIGEKADLDNDGENELIMNGPYGGMYLDARDGKVYEWAAGEGNALTLSYTVYNGAVWIMYSNSMNAGYESYHMERFEGADNLVAEMDFSEELVDGSNPEAGAKYTLNGAEVSYDEYAEWGSKIFAAQVTTN